MLGALFARRNDMRNLSLLCVFCVVVGCYRTDDRAPRVHRGMDAGVGSDVSGADVSAADVSGADVSGSDASGSDAGEDDAETRPRPPQLGDPCRDAADCAPGHTCYLDWPGGYCTQDCSETGECEDGICFRRGDDYLCAAFCTYLEGADLDDPSSWITDQESARGGCRPSYRCNWFRDDEEEDNGECVAGMFNELAVNNIGEACTRNEECYSPFGQGTCLAAGYCSLLGCAGIEMRGVDICGDRAFCSFHEWFPESSLCIRSCTSGDDCDRGSSCRDVRRPRGNPSCTPSNDCGRDEHCHSDETCVADPTGGDGQCMPR